MNERKEDAVSPVVGVMLMLVVTIIIAAVVSGFAGGLAGSTKAAPQASIAVKIDTAMSTGMGPATPGATFTLLSGDSIPTSDIAIITYYTNKTGYVYKHDQTASSPATNTGGTYATTYRVPILNDARLGYARSSNPLPDFGNYTWKTGDVLSTNPASSSQGLYDLLGIDPSIETDFGPGSVVDVKILHSPSGKYVYDKEVVVL